MLAKLDQLACSGELTIDPVCSLRYLAGPCQWIRTSSQNCWNWHVRRPHFGIFELLFQKTHSLHEANLCSESRGETNYLCPKNTLCHSPVLLIRKLIALVGSSAKGPGHPEPFDERSARIKSTWRASFGLTAGRPSDFFSVLKCVKNPFNDASAEIWENLEMDSVTTEREDTWERVA